MDSNEHEAPVTLVDRDYEKEQLGRLNHRLEAYIKVVREQKLEKTEESSLHVVSAGAEYENQLTVMRRENEKLKYELEKAEKSKLNHEEVVVRMRKDVDDALIAKLYADKKLELIQDELKLLQAANKEISDMANQMRMESIESRSKISDLELKLQQSREKLELYLIDRTKLMASKTSLELEIVTYERLLKAEEERIMRRNEERKFVESEKVITVTRESEEYHEATKSTMETTYESEVTAYSKTDVVAAFDSRSITSEGKDNETKKSDKSLFRGIFSSKKKNSSSEAKIEEIDSEEPVADERLSYQSGVGNYMGSVESMTEFTTFAEPHESSSSSSSSSADEKEQETKKSSRFKIGGLFAGKKKKAAMGV